MIRKRIKYIKGFILFALFSILAFSPLCFIGAYAWSTDSNGNLVSDNLIDASNREGRYWVTTQSDISATINDLDLGTYTISCDLIPLSIDNGYNIDDCFFALQLVGGQYTSDGEIVGVFGFTSLNETKRASLTFTKENYTNYEFKLWGFGNHNGGNHGIGRISNIMLNTGSSALSYEPYGSVYYSQENYDNVLTNNYGLFTYCSSIDLKLTSTSDDSIISDSWNNIAELLADKYYVKCSNGEFSYNNSSLSMDYLNGASSHRVMWQFNFNGTYPPISNFNSFTASGYNVRWQLINQNNSLIAYDNINSNALVDLSAYDSEQFGYFQLFTGVPGVAVNFTSLYFNTYYDVAYTRGSTIGYNKGVSYADSRVNPYSASYEAGRSTGFDTGYRDGYDASLRTVDVDSASYKAGQDSNGGYSTGFAAGYAKGRTDQSTITDTNTQASDLLWTIGSTPWESFKNIWNVNLLGVNLANLVTGFITAIILIWIIKKFWK